jgi:hypothetical protein
MLAALRAAWAALHRHGGERRHLLALERELALMADRVARAELLAQRQATQARQAAARALAAEVALVRLQDSLDHARRRVA